MSELEIRPPTWPLKFLRFFLKKEYLEEIEGDMEEVFQDNVSRLSLKQARRIYVWEMLSLLRPILIRNLEVLQRLNQYGMFKNYFKISFRGLIKSPLNSFINVFGLSAAIGMCVFGYAFARWTFSTDQFHEHKNEVYLTTFFADRDGKVQQFGRTPRPLGEMLRQDFVKIKKVCRVEDRSVIVKKEDHVFHERVRYVDPEFLEMLTFPLKWGAAKSLKDVNSIIISEPMSVKYFGEENPIGQNIQVIFDQNRSKEFKVTGVAREFPPASTIAFSFLINFENFRTSEPAYDFENWNEFVNATLIQVDHPSDLKSIERGMEKYRAIQNKAVSEDWAITSFAFEPLATLHKASENIRDGISRSSKDDYTSVIYMFVICGFLLLLACFNYINIAIVTAAKRLKEIGIRKSIGATRRVVIVQFLSENLVITFFALIIGLLLGYTFFIPGFEALWHFDMNFKFNDGMLWIYLVAVLLITSVASGIYPSLYISKFQVVGILKGSVKFGQKNPVTKIFMTLQLILACIFVTGSVMFTQNRYYMAQRSWGYNQDDALYARVPDYASYQKLHDAMAQDANVLSISGSTHHVGKSHSSTVLHFPDREYEVDQLSVDAKYFETMGLPLKAGRFFHDHAGSDKRAVVVNELMVGNMGWTNAIGQVFKIDSIEYEVVGVVKDFHSYSFAKTVAPTIFKVAEQNDYRFLSLQVRHGAEIKTFEKLQAKWAELFPEIPFDGGHQEDVWGNYFVTIGIYGVVWRVIALIAISLASLGLYGLIKLNVEGRTKEFSIRKVLGAGLKNIVSNVSSQYVALLIVALVIGAPVSYFLIGFVVSTASAYHMPIDFSGTLIAVAILILVFLFTITTQVRTVLKTNPVNGLKVE